MAPETWLIKVKMTISRSFNSVRANSPTTKKLLIKKSGVGVLAFEIAGLMSQLLHLWQSLSDENIHRLRAESICLEGVRKIVSDDDAFLLALACAELTDNLRTLVNFTSRICNKCEDSSLRSFDLLFDEFVTSGRDPNNWLLSPKEMESKVKKMDKLVAITSSLHKQMDELLALENSLKKSLQSSKTKDYNNHNDEHKIIELRHKILWQRQEIKYLKDKSLWHRSFDTVTLLLARSVFTILSRIKLVFALEAGLPISLPRSLSSSSALVYPSENPTTCPSVPGPLAKNPPNVHGFFDINSEILKPPSSTLGAAALCLHYSNLIVVMEKMIRYPQLIGVDARDDLYSMLTNSIRFALRARLKGVGYLGLAAEWRDALQKIMGWLSPLAHNMIKWRSERSFEQQHKSVPKTNVLLLQTLYFANQEKTEAAITELLVGLNYIWRFEREMNAKPIVFHNGNFNGYLNSQDSN